MKWYVFSSFPEDAEETLTTHESYADAVFEAQCRHDTQSRPRRLSIGLYKLGGENYASYIASNEGIELNGLLEDLRNLLKSSRI